MDTVEDDIRNIVAKAQLEDAPTVKEAVELNIVRLGSEVTIYPPAKKGMKQPHFTLRVGTEGVILWRKMVGKIAYHVVHFSPDLPAQLIGFNSLHIYDTVKRHPDDNLNLVLDSTQKV